MEKQFIKVCKVSDLKEKQGKRFFVDDTDIAVFKVDGKVHAVDNRCPHQQANIIYDGIVEDGHVICPAHNWMFSLETGKMKVANSKLQVHEVQIVDDMVYVKVKKKEFKW